jgi:predicted RNase H-like nuclease (RuvC/YqgF family)
MSFRDNLKIEIASLEKEIAESKNQNLELENRLLKLKLSEMEEDMREDTNPSQTLLKG